MYTLNAQEARVVASHIKRIFEAPSVNARAEAVRRLFVEELDFHPADRQISLASASNTVVLPEDAHHVASLDTAHVVYVALNIQGVERVRKAEAAEAAKLISSQLGGDLLLIFTNTSISQLHLIYPTFVGKRPTLRRMIVERDLPQRTAMEQIAKIHCHWREKNSIHFALESAFDVEAVTKRFFSEYKRVFDAALEKVTGFGQSQEERENKRLFVQTLFNRLMFVYFLSRKGWLTFKEDKDYLNALWKHYAAQKDETNFYSDRLYHLFFFGLNNPQSQDLNFRDSFMESVYGSVPFLNGGLFEETYLDKRDGIVVPDEAVKPILTDLFNRFNFTVMESTPFDIEVAVDPEMLGKVFEELVTGRHESGSYYTPRPVVAFMCREGLKGYLAGENTGLSDEEIANFVDNHDTHGISITSAQQLADALKKVTIVDPACGSGAYLLGMMQELVELQTTLFSDQLLADSQSLYDLKLRIIQRNLYGVDNDRFATNIAMLRLWLALAIEYEGERPEPLPNLDFKIVCGDSLLGPDPDPKSFGDLFRAGVHMAADDLAILKEKFLGSTGAEKDRLKKQVEELQDQLKSARAEASPPPEVVDWSVEFAEVFEKRGGFDIVVANPPYVRQEGLTLQKTELARLYPEVYDGRADVLVYFYARAVQLLRSDGSLSFITSNTFTKRKYGAKLRNLLSSQVTIARLIDFGEVKIFGATVEVLVLVGRKSPPVHNSIVRGHNLYPLLTRKLGRSASVEKAGDEMTRLADHLKAEEALFPQTRLRNSVWRIEDENVNRLFEQLMSQGTPLDEFSDGHIFRGVVTGPNKAFVIDRAKRNELVAADSRSAALINPWLRGKDIKRWSAEWAGLYIIFVNRGIDIEMYPAIEEHLSHFRTQLEQRATSHLHPWYELQQPQEGIYHYFSNHKIVWPDIARDVRFAYDTDGCYLGNTGYIMPTEAMWMLAVLNSFLFEFLLCQIANSLRGGFVRLIHQYVSRLPIVTPDSLRKNRLMDIAQTCVSGDTVDDDELNDIVSGLYKLSDRDIALIKDWFERRSLTSK
ncbi:MAG: Eco57I restriction-modification methylase domain-containing protein [Caldilineaceae bacterium]|nr:Eco57I restriction-modification methylase domain-containing protein [Caldilineaceae bacterium]